MHAQSQEPAVRPASTRVIAIAAAVLLSTTASVATPVAVGSFNWDSLNNTVRFVLTVDDFRIINGSVSARTYPTGAIVNVIPGTSIGPGIHTSSGSYGGTANYQFLLFAGGNTLNDVAHETFYTWTAGSGGSLHALPATHQDVIYANLASLTLELPPAFYADAGSSVEIKGTIVNNNPGWYLSLSDGTALGQGRTPISFGTVPIPADGKPGDLVLSDTALISATHSLGDSAVYSVYVAPDNGSTALLFCAALCMPWLFTRFSKRLPGRAARTQEIDRVRNREGPRLDS